MYLGAVAYSFIFNNRKCRTLGWYNTNIYFAGRRTYHANHSSVVMSDTIKAILKRHIECVHGKKYHCTICLAKFYKKDGLERHLEIFHEGKKDHVCTFCPAKFGYTSVLKIHIETHHPNLA